MRPQGAAGRVFGVLMEAINAPAYRFALDLLALEPTSDVLEIGFGTGRMIELMAEQTAGRIVGVDPTPTMVAAAERRLRRLGDRVSLSLGGDADLDFTAGGFDRITALHAFQFWPDPAATVRRLRELLRPGARVVLVLRDHERRASDWLPNPLSRAPGEAEAARALLADAGFSARVEHFGHMVGVVGEAR
jgi:cyclopropane fatty-acyl-phospholipid synthase-like methyltransferase